MVDQLRDLSHCPTIADQYHKKAAIVRSGEVKHILHFEDGSRDVWDLRHEGRQLLLCCQCGSLRDGGLVDCCIHLLSIEECHCYADNDVDFASKRQIRKMALSVKLSDEVVIG